MLIAVQLAAPTAFVTQGCAAAITAGPRVADSCIGATSQAQRDRRNGGVDTQLLAMAARARRHPDLTRHADDDGKVGSNDRLVLDDARLDDVASALNGPVLARDRAALVARIAPRYLYR